MMKRNILAAITKRSFSAQTATTLSPPHSNPVPYQYYVPRNSNHSLPVYSDLRNQGARYFVLIRNIQGNANALASDLKATLFQPGSPEADRLHVDIIRSKHLVLTGGRWKNHVVEWLQQKGF